MKITIAQFNPIVGDVAGNAASMLDLVRLNASSSDLVIFPELSVTGYPPRDLLERGWFIDAVEGEIEKIARFTSSIPGCGVLFGAPVRNGSTIGTGLSNAALLAHRGEIIFQQAKTLLPTYDVFDEHRYFDPASDRRTVRFGDQTLGINICEDAWNDSSMWHGNRRYPADPVEELASKGATILVNISASPFEADKHALRALLIRSHAKRHGLPFAYVNQVGGNDELVFDGGSMFIDSSGNASALLPFFSEAVATLDTASLSSCEKDEQENKPGMIYRALVLGVRDYLHKTGFRKAVIGLSGGIDSAVVCCVAVQALGAQNVIGISMPSPYSSAGSVEDSRQLAANLGISFRVIPISEVFRSYLDLLEPQFEGLPEDTTEENIQARIRGNYLMAFSNKYGSIVLSTGNKSELAVGYCTLYGDMSGGLSVISDVPKTMVYAIAGHINRAGAVIPMQIIEKPPSAELKAGQKDQDTLPPYEILDAILHRYIEDGQSLREIVMEGFEPKTVDWVIKTVNRNEYKRRQAAPGLKVTSKAFGAGRRIPIAARY